jgi:hypothetical protein
VFDQFAAHGESSLRAGPKNDPRLEKILTHQIAAPALRTGQASHCLSIDAMKIAFRGRQESSLRCASSWVLSFVPESR